MCSLHIVFFIARNFKCTSIFLYKFFWRWPLHLVLEAKEWEAWRLRISVESYLHHIADSFSFLSCNNLHTTLNLNFVHWCLLSVQTHDFSFFPAQSWGLLLLHKSESSVKWCWFCFYYCGLWMTTFLLYDCLANVGLSFLFFWIHLLDQYS